MSIRSIAVAVLFIVTMSSSGRGYSLTAESGIGGVTAHTPPPSKIHEQESEVDTATANDISYWMAREPTAYLSLGLCFAEGIGVQKDAVEAAFWLLLAVRNLHEGSNRSEASEKLSELRQSMSAEQIAESMKKADVFKPLRQTRYKIGDPPPKKQ